jgi:hypothetical protein
VNALDVAVVKRQLTRTLAPAPAIAPAPADDDRPRRIADEVLSPT